MQCVTKFRPGSTFSTMRSLYSLQQPFIVERMAMFENIPKLNNFLGHMDLKTGCYVIATFGMTYPLTSLQVCARHTSWLFVTLSALLAIHSAACAGLFLAVLWCWYYMVSVWLVYSILLLPMVGLMLVMAASARYDSCCCSIVCWYLVHNSLWILAMMYSVVVVNSYQDEMQC